MRSMSRIELRRRVLEQREHLGHARRLRGAPHHRRRVQLCSACDPRPARSSTIMRNPPALPIPCTGRRLDHDEECLLDRRRAASNSSPWMAPTDLRRIAAALVERVEHGEDGAGIRRLGESRAGEADDVDCHAQRPASQRNVRRAPHHLVGARERGAGRKLRRDDEEATIDLRNEADRGLAELVEAERQNPGIDEEHQQPRSAPTRAASQP